MSLMVKNSGVWKSAKQAHVKDAGIWKPAREIFVKDAGVWKPVLKYPTTFLLHGDGTNGSQVFADSSIRQHAVNVLGNAQISTAQSKVGGSSIYFDGTDDALYCDDADAFDVANDFTMECFVNFPAKGNPYNAAIFDLRPLGMSSPPGIRVSIDYNERISLVIDEINRAQSAVLAVNTWHHVALTRASNVFRLFINGSQVGSSYANTTAYDGGSLTLGIPVDVRGPRALIYQGYMDEVRFSKGLARYTASFTPPSAAFDPFE